MEGGCSETPILGLGLPTHLGQLFKYQYATSSADSCPVEITGGVDACRGLSEYSPLMCPAPRTGVDNGHHQ